MQEVLAKLDQYELEHAEEMERLKVSNWHKRGEYSNLCIMVRDLKGRSNNIKSMPIRDGADALNLRGAINIYTEEVNRFRDEVDRLVVKRKDGFRTIFNLTPHEAKEKLAKVEPTWKEFL